MNAASADIALFDGAAETYDASFSQTLLGRLLRRAVHDEVRQAFALGETVLDLGCGTGEDAVFLASRGVFVHGIDASRQMVDQARAKAARNPRSTAPRFDVANLDEDPLPPGRFDGAISNFGVLNCLRDRAAFAERLAHALRPGAPAIFVVMGRRCPWEWVWHLLHAGPRTAFRRLRGRAAYNDETISYPTPSDLGREFKPHFRVVRTSGIGILLPPTEMSALVERHPQIALAVDTAERRIRRLPLTARFSDHFLIELERL